MEEVHRWRGSAHERATLAQSSKTGQFSYFDQQLGQPNWTALRVLDFGGNEGGLLDDPACTIRAENYYCVDVIGDALEQGRRKFPRAHWIHYNRYNPSFNPAGVPGLRVPEMPVNFDVILAYSVFTHTTRDEMHELIRQLLTLLVPGGAFAFTFIDPHFVSRPDQSSANNLRWRLDRVRELNPGLDVDSLIGQSRGADWCALVDGKALYVNDNGLWENETATCMTYNVYYSVGFLQSEFPQGTILAPVNGEMQHCCIIRRRIDGAFQ